MVRVPLGAGRARRDDVPTGALRLWALGVLTVLSGLAGIPCDAWAQATEQALLTIDPGGHWAAIRRIDISKDASLVATASDDKTVRIWSAPDRSLLQTLRPTAGPGAEGRMYGVAFHPHRSLLAVGGTGAPGQGGRIFLFEPRTGELLRVISSPAGEVKRLRWNSGGTALVAAYAAPGALRIFNVDGVETASERFDGDVYAADTSSTGLVAAADTSGEVRVFRLSASGELQRVSSERTGLPDAVALAFSPDGSRLALAHFGRDRNGRVELLGPDAKPERSLRWNGIGPGRTQALAWSTDGQRIVVGGVRNEPGASGRAAIEAVRGFVFRYSIRSGQAEAAVDVASDSVTDLASLEDGATLFSSFDARWGRWDGSSGSAASMSTGSSSFVRRSDRLWIAPDAVAVQWQPGAAESPISFVLSERVIRLGPLGDGVAPETPGPFSGTRGWESAPGAEVSILGAVMPLGSGELSRAVARIGRSEDVIWGTGHRLMRVGRGGKVVWTVRPGVESRAVHASSDARLVVAAMSDGTVRWYRASDGTLLLSLYAPDPDRWVLWTPAGYYDASIGGEHLIGWQVIGAVDAPPRFFTIGRFRERFHRPDVIDRVLRLADEPLAVASADEDRARALASSGDKLPTRQASAPPPILSSLPPMLVYKQARVLQTDAETVALEFGAIVRDNEPLSSVVVRRDGVLQAARDLRLPPSFDGHSAGSVRVEVPTGESIVHVVAQNANGYSDPLTFIVQRAPPRAEQPVPLARTRPASGRLFLLAIGVASYLDKEISELGFSAKDASDVAALLRRQNGRAYASVEARVLTDKGATKETIAQGLSWFSQAVGPGDTGILFLAGHAVNHPNGSYYFLAHDTRINGIAESAVAETAIRSTLVRLRGRAVLFVDTCHAGNAVGNALGFIRDMNRIANDLSSAENGVIVFASSTGRQESWERSAWGNGAFTKAMLAGMQGGADMLREGRVTFRGLGYYVSAEVRKLTKGQQTPVLISPPPGIADFTLALTAERIAAGDGLQPLPYSVSSLRSNAW